MDARVDKHYFKAFGFTSGSVYDTEEERDKACDAYIESHIRAYKYTTTEEDAPHRERSLKLFHHCKK